MDFTFVGSTIMYAYMQATGMVNDHTTTAFATGVPAVLQTLTSRLKC